MKKTTTFFIFLAMSGLISLFSINSGNMLILYGERTLSFSYKYAEENSGEYLVDSIFYLDGYVRNIYKHDLENKKFYSAHCIIEPISQRRCWSNPNSDCQLRWAEYSYDENHNVISNGNVRDQSGRLIERLSSRDLKRFTYDDVGNIRIRETLEKDSENNWNLIFKTEFIYDEKGYLLKGESQQYKDGAWVDSPIVEEFICDDDGNVIEHLKDDKESTWYSREKLYYTYDYDNKGNPIFKTISSWMWRDDYWALDENIKIFYTKMEKTSTGIYDSTTNLENINIDFDGKTLSVESADVKLITVYDLLGRVCVRVSDCNILSLENQTGGIYLSKVVLSNGKVLQKKIHIR